VEDGPRMPFGAMDPAHRCPLSSPAEVFEDECLADNDGLVAALLTERVVGSSLQAGFAPPYAMETARGGARPAGLRAWAARVVSGTHDVDLLPAEGRARALAGQVDPAQVDVQHPAGGCARRATVTADSGPWQAPAA
jgi:hypothetical protein